MVLFLFPLEAKSEFEQRIAELHTNGDAKEALGEALSATQEKCLLFIMEMFQFFVCFCVCVWLALSVINLNNELRNLRELMSMADTPQKKEGRYPQWMFDLHLH